MEKCMHANSKECDEKCPKPTPRFSMLTPYENVQEAISILAKDSTTWGSDDCGCDDCASLRKSARLAMLLRLAAAIAKLSA